MAGGHGYYNLEGNFVETASKHEATLAWRQERGYSNVGFGGGEAALPEVPASTAPDMPGGGQQPWQILGQEQDQPAGGSSLVGSNIGDRQYNLSQFGTPSDPSIGDLSMQAKIEARGGYTLFDEARARIEARGGYNIGGTPDTLDPLQQQYMELYGVPYNPYTGPDAPFDESKDPQAIAQEQYLAEEIEPVTRQFSRYTGDQYYSGGSEQATLGVYNQQLANLGMLSSEELGFMNITPTDQMSWVLSPADVRRLTSQDPALSSYASDLRTNYGDDWFEQLYEIDEETGWAQLISYGEEDSYDGGGWGGYGGWGSGGGGGGYGSTYRAAAQNGLVNWRIGV